MEISNLRPVSGISDVQAKSISSALNVLLANEYALFTKALNYHWNITGPRFKSLHNFLEEQYKSLLTTMDDIAERVRIVGEYPISTVERFNEVISLEEKNGKFLSSNEMIKDLLDTNIKIQHFIKETLDEKSMFENDYGTEDFLVGLIRQHEKTTWMLKSYLD